MYLLIHVRKRKVTKKRYIYKVFLRFICGGILEMQNYFLFNFL